MVHSTHRRSLKSGNNVQASAAFFIWSNERCVLAEGHTSLKGGRSEFVFLRRSHSVGCNVCDCIGFVFNSFLQVAILPLLATESNAPQSDERAPERQSCSLVLPLNGGHMMLLSFNSISDQAP